MNEKRNRWDLELDNINPNGSLKKSPKGWPSQKKIEAAQRKKKTLFDRLEKEKPETLSSLAPFISEHLNKLGSLSGNIKYGSPEHFFQGEYITNNDYNFLGKNVKGSVKMDREDLSDYKELILQDFASYFPGINIDEIEEGKIVIKGNSTW